MHLVSFAWPMHGCDSTKSISETDDLGTNKNDCFKNISDCLNKMFGTALVTSSRSPWFCVQKEEIWCFISTEIYNIFNHGDRFNLFFFQYQVPKRALNRTSNLFFLGYCVTELGILHRLSFLSCWTTLRTFT